MENRKWHMKKMIQWDFHIDCSLDMENKALVYSVNTERGKEVCRIRFARDGMSEKSHGLARVVEIFWKAGLLTPGNVGFRNVLTKRERELVHDLFPYVPCYKNMWAFQKLYAKYNETFDYAVYEQLKEYGEKLRNDPDEPAEGVWKEVTVGGALFLSCKWQDEAGEHVVLADDRMFYSDCSFEQVCGAENGFYVAEGVDAFAAEHAASMLDSYLGNGGSRILYFLTAARHDHLFELLGKSGLGNLADQMEHYNGINKKGKNIREIFGVPVRCLRALSSNNDLMLYDREDRKVLQWAYEKCPDLFDRPITVIDEMWFRYCYQYEDLQISDDKKLGDILRKSTKYLNKKAASMKNPYQVFGLYENYIRYSIRIGKYYYGFYPADLDRAVAECVDYLQKLYEEERAQEFYHAVNREEYMVCEDDVDGEPYRIARPKSAKELMHAGNELCNCLRSYVSKIKQQRTMVGLIYEKEHDKLIGAIEVRGDYVVQAKGPCNNMLEPEVRAYIWRYMDRKHLAWR